MKICHWIMLILLLGGHAASGQECVDYGDYYRTTGLSYETRGFCMALVGDLAYIGTVDAKLKVMDLSDEENPAIVATLALPQKPWEIQIQGEMAYLTAQGPEAGSSQFLAVDISDPLAPAILGNLMLRLKGYGFAVEGDHAYVSDGAFSAGEYLVKVVDISDPTAMTVVGECHLDNEVLDVEYHDGKIYATTLQSSLMVFDVSDPTNPQQTANVGTNGFCTSVKVDWPYLYLANGPSGLQVMDLGIYPIPWPVSQLDTPGNAGGLEVHGDRLFIADEDDVQVVDISTPAQPLLFGGVGRVSNAVAIHEGRLLNLGNPFQIVDIEGRDLVPVIDALEFLDGVTDMEVHGDRILVGDFSGGLTVFELGAAGDMRLVGSSEPRWQCSSVHGAGDLVIMAEYWYGVSIHDPQAPPGEGLLGHLSTNQFTYRIAHSGTTAYVTDGSAGIFIMDFSDPTEPYHVDSLATSYWPSDLLVHDGYLVVATFRDDEAYSALMIFDISDPASPQLIGTLGCSGKASSVACEGGLAYMALGSEGLLTVDISDPVQPTIVQQRDYAMEVEEVMVQDGVLYLGLEYFGMEVLDVSDPQDYQVIGNRNAYFSTKAFAVQGPYLIQATNGVGLEVFPAQCPTSGGVSGVEPEAGPGAVPSLAGRLDSYPNPFNPGTTILMDPEKAGHHDLAILDVAGNRVRTLHQGYMPAERQEIYWNGQDDEGRVVSAGVYLVQLVSESQTLNRKITMIK